MSSEPKEHNTRAVDSDKELCQYRNNAERLIGWEKRDPDDLLTIRKTVTNSAGRINIAVIP